MTRSVTRRGVAVALVALASMLGACTTGSGKTFPGGIDGAIPASGSMIPDATLQVTPGISFTLEKLALTGLGLAALKVVYDPLAPNWDIQQASLDADTYYVKLMAKRFRTGGDGEAVMIMRRRAIELQRGGGYQGYKLLDYAEGIESSTPVSQKYAEGIIRLVRAGSAAAAP